MEQKIKLNNILHISDEEMKKYKLHLAAFNGHEHPLDVFARSFADWKNWNEWRGNKNDFNREFIFTLIPDYTRVNKYIFGGVFSVLDRFDNYEETEIGYKIEHSNLYKELTGRLVIDFERYQGMRGRAFRLESFIDSMTVSEITEESYGGISFPGYESIVLPFRMLELLVTNQKRDWITALCNVKGVYVIMDRKNGKKYIGSAYGDCGIWSRWSSYANTGHGHNAGLVELIDEKGIEYARQYFQIALLEVLPMRSDDDYVINRENFWKDLLLSRGEFGYNKN